MDWRAACERRVGCSDRSTFALGSGSDPSVLRNFANNFRNISDNRGSFPQLTRFATFDLGRASADTKRLHARAKPGATATGGRNQAAQIAALILSRMASDFASSPKTPTRI